VHPDGRTGDTPNALGEPNVVRVRVSHQDRPNVLEGPAEGIQGCGKIEPMRG
jgi:hypothetical protein